MKPYPIIGVTGYARVGKDTAARGLPGYQRRAFADALKLECRAFCLSAYKIDPNTDDAREKALIRWLLVGHGETMRRLNPRYWIDHVEASMMREVTGPMTGKTVDLERIPAKWVITDVRYRNEAEWVEAQGGINILIIRPNHGPANPTEAASIAEIIAVGLVHATIDNCGTIEDLHRLTRSVAGID